LFLVYIDDSGDERVRCFSALVVHETKWREVQQQIRQHRRDMKRTDGILITKELHATEFVSGRGRLGSNDVHKGRRCELFGKTLQMIANLPKIRIFNAIAPRNAEAQLFERLINRIHTTMGAWNNRALIVHDEGKDFTPLVRRMGIYNPVHSQFGAWGNGQPTKNIPTERIIEDIVFRESHRSDLIQMADFCAYALLRSEYPIASKNKYGLDKSFDAIAAVCCAEAYRADPRKLGIIRA
jgi:hypothetical protein